MILLKVQMQWQRLQTWCPISQNAGHTYKQGMLLGTSSFFETQLDIVTGKLTDFGCQDNVTSTSKAVCSKALEYEEPHLQVPCIEFGDCLEFGCLLGNIKVSELLGGGPGPHPPTLPF